MRNNVIVTDPEIMSGEPVFRGKRVTAQILTEDDKEDLGLLKMMTEADRTQKVSKEQIIRHLQSFSLINHV